MKILFACILIFAIKFSATAQTVSLIAGNGTLTGYGIPATDANLGGALAGMCCDRYGNIFVAQMYSNTVIKIDTEGYLYLVAGTGVAGYSGDNGPATSAELHAPQSVGLDTSENIYITDAENGRVRKVDALTGVITTVCGTGIQRDSGDGGSASVASCKLPTDVKFDKFNNMYVSSASAGSIRKINQFGIITKIAGGDSLGNTGDEGLATNARIIPSFLYINNKCEIYFSGSTSGSTSIRKIDSNGIIHHVAGLYSYGFYNGDEIPAINSGIDPQQIIGLEDGSIYFADHYNNRIRFIDKLGIIHTCLGDGSASSEGDGMHIDSAKVNGPSGLTFDQCHNILFNQTVEQRIRKITFDHCNYLSVNQLATKNQQAKITPNPVIGLLYINSEVEIESIEIFDFTGRCIFSTSPKQFNFSVPTDGWSNGLYLVRVNHEQIQKVLKN